MDSQNPDWGYRTADSFFKNPRKNTIIQDVRRELAEERRKTIIDPYVLRLNQQMVGAEADR